MQKKLLHVAIVALFVGAAASAAAYNNTSLKWETLTTPHFEIHYHQGAEWTAQQVAQIAEEVNGPLTSLYHYEPSYPVHFIIRDTDDYANGAAYFYDNKVEIWATNLEFGFRGTSDWLRNVVTHEYTHIISIQASTRLPQRIPAVYFQAIGFEEEKRSDVLQGYPKNLVSFPFSGVMIPPWFAEGVAQFQSPDAQYDCWDTHRDMILRCAVLEDKMLTYDEMGFFGKNGLQGEQVYDHGYGLVSHIASQYGPEALAATAKSLKTLYRLNMDGALKGSTGKSGGELYTDWKSQLKTRYDQQVAPIRETERDGKVIASGGYMTIAPTLSPDGKRVVYLSNAGSDYSTTSLHVKTIGDERSKVVAGGVSSPAQFSPEGGKVVYSKKARINRYGSEVNDVYVYDFGTRKEKRLTKGSRIAEPDFSPDGKKLVGVSNSDGTHQLVVMDGDGRNQTVIFERAKGTQIYHPHFSPDGTRIMFGIFEGETRDIAEVASDGGQFAYILQSPNDERDARWMSNERIVFASDRSGIFNIYELDLGSGWVDQRSNVVGGGFLPDVSKDGASIVYSGYNAEGYRVLRLDRTGDAVQTMDRIAYATRAAGEFDECEARRSQAASRRAETTLALASEDPTAFAAGSDVTESSPTESGGAQSFASSSYKSAYTPFQFYPRLVIWDGTFRLGLAVSSFEILDKQGLFFGGSYGTDKEFDGFLSYEIRNFYPTLFVDFLYVRERTTDQAVDYDLMSPTLDHSFYYELRYDLWIADLGLKLELNELFSPNHRNELAIYWSHPEYSINVKVDVYDKSNQYVTSDDAGWKYYIGNQANLRWSFRGVASAVDADINPRGGRNVTVAYMRAFDELFENGEFEYGFRPVFTANDYSQYSLDWREFIGFPWWRHSLRLRLYGAVIDNDVNSFFWVYMGGRDGIRGYNYYSIGGRKGVVGSVAYRFPIVRSIDRQFFSMYFRDVYGSVFYELANAWDGLPKVAGESSGFKDSFGWELRFSLGAYYVFPTAVSIVGAYAFDPTFFRDPGFGVPRKLTQEPSWSYYLTVGFGFEL